MKQIKDGPGEKSLRPEQLRKYDFLRAEVAFMDTPSNGPTTDTSNESIGLVSNDDDDSDVLEIVLSIH